MRYIQRILQDAGCCAKRRKNSIEEVKPAISVNNTFFHHDFIKMFLERTSRIWVFALDAEVCGESIIYLCQGEFYT